MDTRHTPFKTAMMMLALAGSGCDDPPDTEPNQGPSRAEAAGSQLASPKPRDCPAGTHLERGDVDGVVGLDAGAAGTCVADERCDASLCASGICVEEGGRAERLSPRMGTARRWYSCASVMPALCPAPCANRPRSVHGGTASSARAVQGAAHRGTAGCGRGGNDS